VNDCRFQLSKCWRAIPMHRRSAIHEKNTSSCASVFVLEHSLEVREVICILRLLGKHKGGKFWSWKAVSDPTFLRRELTFNACAAQWSRFRRRECDKQEASYVVDCMKSYCGQWWSHGLDIPSRSALSKSVKLYLAMILGSIIDTTRDANRRRTWNTQ